MAAWWRWALVSPDGVAPSQMAGVSASVNLPLHHKVQKFSSGTGSPGWSRKKTVKRLWCQLRSDQRLVNRCAWCNLTLVVRGWGRTWLLVGRPRTVLSPLICHCCAELVWLKQPSEVTVLLWYKSAARNGQQESLYTHTYTHSSHFPREYWLASELFSVASGYTA